MFALGRTPLRPQGHVCDQIRSLAHEFPVAEATTMWEICVVDQGEPLVSIVLRVFKSRKHRKCLDLASPAASSASGA